MNLVKLMKTVINNKIEIIIKKSKFITFTYNISNKEEINEKLNELRNNYSDATHICYAYIIDNSEKYEDDDEPSGTAGMPILNVLQKENLKNVLCVVIRYFGGIKLGAGGLVRAYSKACKEAIITKTLENGYKIKITFEYNDVKKIDYLLKNSQIINKDYDLKTSYIILINEIEYETIKDNLKQISEIEIIENILI